MAQFNIQVNKITDRLPNRMKASSDKINFLESMNVNYNLPVSLTSNKLPDGSTSFRDL